MSGVLLRTTARCAGLTVVPPMGGWTQRQIGFPVNSVALNSPTWSVSVFGQLADFLESIDAADAPHAVTGNVPRLGLHPWRSMLRPDTSIIGLLVSTAEVVCAVFALAIVAYFRKHGQLLLPLFILQASLV